jgi:hypothetical protein
MTKRISKVGLVGLGLVLVLTGCQIAVLIFPADTWGINFVYDPMRAAASAEIEGFGDIVVTFDNGPAITSTPIIGFFDTATPPAQTNTPTSFG